MARVLMVVTSARIFELARDPQHPTGFWAEEVLKPYDRFVRAGIEIVVATPDGRPPQADPFSLETRFHYPDEDKDFLASIERSFASDVDDCRVTLHQSTEIDLIAARRVFVALIEAGLDAATARAVVARHARAAWRDDCSFIDVLAGEDEIVGRLPSERLLAVREEVQEASAAEVARVVERLSSIEGLSNPRDLRTMPDEEILGFDAVFIPGGHGPMVDLSANPDVRRTLHLMADKEGSTIATVCHGGAALLSAGDGPEGGWLFDGYRMTAFTDEEEDQTPYGQLGVPWYVEGSLKNRGAVFDEVDTLWATSHVVVDRNLITGKNSGASEATAEALIRRLGVSAR